jgi:hypothetical protein
VDSLLVSVISDFTSLAENARENYLDLKQTISNSLETSASIELQHKFGSKLCSSKMKLQHSSKKTSETFPKLHLKTFNLSSPPPILTLTITDLHQKKRDDDNWAIILFTSIKSVTQLNIIANKYLMRNLRGAKLWQLFLKAFFNVVSITVSKKGVFLVRLRVAKWGREGEKLINNEWNREKMENFVDLSMLKLSLATFSRGGDLET